jgi:hypothetical protein
MRESVGRWVVLGLLGVFVALLLFCAGTFVFGKKQTDSAIDAMKREGVPITSVQDAPIKDGRTVTAHKIFTTSSGKQGHILQKQAAPSVSAVADEYLPGQRYLFSHNLIVIVVGPDWVFEHPERIKAALDRLD